MKKSAVQKLEFQTELKKMISPKRAIIFSLALMLFTLAVIEGCGSAKSTTTATVPPKERESSASVSTGAPAKTRVVKTVTPEINYRESAKQAHAKGDYKEALTLYKKHKQQTGDASVDGDINDCSEKLTGESEQVCKDGIKLYLNENYEEALAHFKKALDLNSSNQLAVEYHKRTVEKLKALKKLENDSDESK
jgi:Flp pilus assembly protein TadD